MNEYTDQQRIARAFLTESRKCIEYHHRVQLEHHRRIQDGYIRTAIRYRLPVEEIERITGREVGDLIDDHN